MKIQPICLAILLLIIAYPAMSDNTQNAAKKEEKETENKDISGKAKLGFIYSQDTDYSTSLNSGLELTYQPGRTSHTLKTYTYYTNASDDDGVNKYNIAYKLATAIDTVNSYFISHEYQHDQYGTYRHKFTATTGLEHKIYHAQDTTLTIGGGPGYRYTKRQASDDSYPNQEKNDIIANGFIVGKTKLSDSLSISGAGDVDYGASGTTYTLDANLTNTLIDNVALAFDTKYIYETEASSSTSHDEIYSTMSITYAF